MTQNNHREQHSKAPLVVARDLAKSYSTGALITPVLRGVTFSIPHGSFAALVGPSGCGKTTLLNLIAGLDLLTKGELIVAGYSLSSMSQRQMARYRLDTLSCVFQFYNLLSTLTALENVELAICHLLCAPKEKKERALGVLEKVGLKHKAHRFPGQLSGGEQQRVAIARALVKQPQLIVADEPTGSLDQKTGRSILDLMLQLNQDCGTTFLLVTHDMSLVKHGSPVFEMEDGVLLHSAD